MSKLKMAVVGAGRLGGFHAQKLGAHQKVDLVAVADPLPQNRNRVAAECRTRALADHQPLLDAVDAVVIAAPTQLHHRLATDFLERGIHVLVEKPICATLDEADRLVATARQNNVVLQVGHIERFNPAFTAAAAAAANPKYIEAVRAGGFTFRSTDVGVVLDLMIHDIDLVLSMVRSPLRRVEALGLSVLGGHEDVANARLHFESGCVATLSASRVSYWLNGSKQVACPARRMQVWSSRACAEIDFNARRTTLVRPSETLLRHRFDVEALTPEQVEHYKEHLADEHLSREQLDFDAVDALALEADDFVESILGPRQPQVSGAAGRDALAVAEQILARIHTHAWDDTVDGPVGPLATPRPRVIPAPHFAVAPADAPAIRKEAG